MHGPLRIIGKSNGVGLSRDLEILASAIRACSRGIEILPIDRRDARLRRSPLRLLAGRLRGLLSAGAPRPFRANIMLEHVWPQYLDSAEINVLVPNPEWFDHRDRRHLARIDRVWAKTRLTERIFAALGARCGYMGFDSEDRHDPAVPKSREFLHLAGSSPMKGTAGIIEAWTRHPRWPKLTVVGRPGRSWRAAQAPNLEVRDRYVEDHELRRLQNHCLFHLCPSQAEGWGHYIVEAMSCEAVVLTLDSPPMNEMVAEGRGLLISAQPGGRQNLVDKVAYAGPALEQAVEAALAMDDGQLQAMGARARRWVLDNKGGFQQRVAAVVQALDR